MRLLLQLGIVVCRFVKRGPGAIVGLALLLACWVGLASWYRDLPVTEPQTPETLAREYVDLIYTGRYAEAEESTRKASRARVLVVTAFSIHRSPRPLNIRSWSS